MPARKTKYSGKNTEIAYETLAWIMKLPGITRLSIIEKSGITPGSVTKHLWAAEKSGLIYKRVVRRTAHYFIQPELFKEASDKCRKSVFS